MNWVEDQPNHSLDSRPEVVTGGGGRRETAGDKLQRLMLVPKAGHQQVGCS